LVSLSSPSTTIGDEIKDLVDKEKDNTVKGFV